MAMQLKGQDTAVTESIVLQPGRYVLSIDSRPENQHQDLILYGPNDYEENFTVGKSGRSSFVVKIASAGAYFLATDQFFEGPWTVSIEPR